jgi:hypothetical protein
MTRLATIIGAIALIAAGLGLAHVLGGGSSASAAVTTVPTTQPSPFSPSALVALQAKEAGIAPATLSAIASAGTDAHRSDIVVGKDTTGATCYTVSSAGGLASPGFRCHSILSDGSAMADFAASGGASVNEAASWASVVGVVSSQVAAVHLTLADGSVVSVEVDPSSGVFGYAADSSGALPMTVDALDASGTIVASDDLAPGNSPPCPGSQSCDDGTQTTTTS